MRALRAISVATILLVSFGYGIGVGTYKWFPFDEVRQVKNIASQIMHSPPPPPPSAPTELHGVNNQLSPNEAMQLRVKLLESIIPANKADVSTRSESEFEVIETTYYGVKVRGQYYSTLDASRCLKIYVQGHDGDPNEFNYHNQLRQIFLNGGCDVLSLSMLGLGLNAGTASFPTRFGELELTPEQASNHGNYSFFYDALNPHLDPLSLFLYPHLNLIDHLIQQNNYDDISVLGISGGGWYTVWLAALMPELKSSLSYAGSLPFAYRIFREHHGDWEQIHSQLYSVVSYLELYQLMRYDSSGNPTREAYLAYNDNDSCCFMNPAASDFKRQVEDLSFYPLVIIDTSNSHSMNVSLVTRLLKHE